MSARNSPELGWIPFGWTAQSLQRRSGRTSKNGRAWQNPWGSELNECVQTADALVGARRARTSPEFRPRPLLADNSRWPMPACDPKRTFAKGSPTPSPPSQRGFALQDFVAHPTLRGIVMRTLVPHYVRLDRYPYWKPYHGQPMLGAKQVGHVVACHKQQVAICEKGRHG